MRSSPESLIDSATIRTREPSKRRTTSRSCPTRFSRNTVNCRSVGQLRPRAVANPIPASSPASPCPTVTTPDGLNSWPADWSPAFAG